MMDHGGENPDLENSHRPTSDMSEKQHTPRRQRNNSE